MLKKEGLLLVISGPSGTGKGTICKKLISENEEIMLSVSATTRKPREGEVEGVSYYFKTKEEFQNMIDSHEFLEYAQIYDNFYGTPKKQILEQLKKGNDVILEIEMQGAAQIKKVFPKSVLIFILPPSLEELKNRIVGRGTETMEQIEKRFSSALDEIKMVTDYDYFVFNEEVEKSTDEIKEIIRVEKLNVDRYKEKIFEMYEKENKTC